jgi:hypothetical protein
LNYRARLALAFGDGNYPELGERMERLKSFPIPEPRDARHL